MEESLCGFWLPQETGWGRHLSCSKAYEASVRWVWGRRETCLQLIYKGFLKKWHLFCVCTHTYMSVCTYMWTPWRICGDQKTLEGVGSLLLPCGSQGQNSEPHACQQVPLLTEASGWPSRSILANSPCCPNSEFVFSAPSIFFFS